MKTSLWVFLGVILAAGTAHALSFVEARVDCRAWTITQDDAGVIHAAASCESFDATGRSLAVFDTDVFPLLSAQQRAQLTAALGGVLQLVRANRSIPSPSPTATTVP